MQQSPHSLAPMSAAPVANITTEQIQKYLDENKQLILAILENQNLGKLAECAQYQAQLQKNLLYLAAIADAQPNAPAVRPQQIMPHGTIPQGGPFMQQSPIFPRGPLPYNPQQMQGQLHSQPPGMVFPGHMSIRPGAVNGLHGSHTEPSHGGTANPLATPSLSGFPPTNSDGRGSKLEAGIAMVPAIAESHRNSGSEPVSGDADQSHAKRPEDTKTP
ncbi:GRF1-interacting factor 2-like isoform X1 [Zingiber officinale]|uniref:GRF1-interacting factor 2-like isoform X1 n=1 Tax=Zingiber officinale TaxID=94328 RepID=UPI001C4CC503|nr:GRF1-interacting factor 2-like isoform X1 [Zingiber officinale]XP_042421744.1 GRF1-interacting factor 2-like isoform X1 [Zingiber officinale]XP_042426796.1 GRF1-interacting factor 2-like isoform X1 [Zingiber officinale]XP_042426797.1 GRF1-interacting factor 2-like isoform X1 [Zingiber officinale]